MTNITNELDNMAKAIVATIMNSESNDPVVPLIVLNRLLCEMLVELGMDNEETAVGAFLESLRSARRDKEVH